MKDLPYFKFDVSEWTNGLITLESLSCQGLFINICAHYWFKSGKLKLSEIKRRISGSKDNDFKSLIDCGVMKVDNDIIKISFLDIQLKERSILSKNNSKNGKLGGRPKTEIKAVGLISVNELKANESNIEEKREEEKRRDIYNPEDFFETKEKAFEEIRDDQLFVECDCINLLSGKGWSSVSALDVIGLLKYFMVSKFDSNKPKPEVKQHFKNWLSSGNTKLPDLVTKAEIFKKQLGA